jgi:hypothetical protein
MFHVRQVPDVVVGIFYRLLLLADIFFFHVRIWQHYYFMILTISRLNDFPTYSLPLGGRGSFHISLM